VNRGDIYLADLNPVRGSQQAGTRPVLIYKHSWLLKRSRTVIIIPFTTNLKMQNLPSCLLIKSGEGDLQRNSVALCHQIRALDKSGLIKHLGSLPPQIMSQLDEVVLFTLGIKDL
jgi:mRNA interferase MazF